MNSLLNMQSYQLISRLVDRILYIKDYHRPNNGLHEAPDDRLLNILSGVQRTAPAEVVTMFIKYMAIQITLRNRMSHEFMNKLRKSQEVSHFPTNNISIHFNYGIQLKDLPGFSNTHASDTSVNGQIEQAVVPADTVRINIPVDKWLIDLSRERWERIQQGELDSTLATYQDLSEDPMIQIGLYLFRTQAPFSNNLELSDIMAGNIPTYEKFLQWSFVLQYILKCSPGYDINDEGMNEFDLRVQYAMDRFIHYLSVERVAESITDENSLLYAEDQNNILLIFKVHCAEIVALLSRDSSLHTQADRITVNHNIVDDSLFFSRMLVYIASFVGNYRETTLQICLDYLEQHFEPHISLTDDYRMYMSVIYYAFMSDMMVNYIDNVASKILPIEIVDVPGHADYSTDVDSINHISNNSIVQRFFERFSYTCDLITDSLPIDTIKHGIRLEYTNHRGWIKSVFGDVIRLKHDRFRSDITRPFEAYIDIRLMTMYLSKCQPNYFNNHLLSGFPSNQYSRSIYEVPNKCIDKEEDANDIVNRIKSILREWSHDPSRLRNNIIPVMNQLSDEVIRLFNIKFYEDLYNGILNKFDEIINTPPELPPDVINELKRIKDEFIHHANVARMVHATMMEDEDDYSEGDYSGGEDFEESEDDISDGDEGEEPDLVTDMIDHVEDDILLSDDEELGPDVDEDDDSFVDSEDSSVDVEGLFEDDDDISEDLIFGPAVDEDDEPYSDSSDEDN